MTEFNSYDSMPERDPRDGSVTPGSIVDIIKSIDEAISAKDYDKATELIKISGSYDPELAELIKGSLGLAKKSPQTDLEQ